MVEAIRYGCIPLLPDRLSYPEIIPKVFHGDFLYKDQTELVEKRYNRLVEIRDNQLKSIFDHLTKSDNHVEKVVKMAKRFGVKTAASA